MASGSSLRGIVGCEKYHVAPFASRFAHEWPLATIAITSATQKPLSLARRWASQFAASEVKLRRASIGVCVINRNREWLAAVHAFETAWNSSEVLYSFGDRFALAASGVCGS